MHEFIMYGELANRDISETWPHVIPCIRDANPAATDDHLLNEDLNLAESHMNNSID